NNRTSILGSTSDNGVPGTATLQNAKVLIVNANQNGNPYDVNLTATQTLSLFVRDGTLNLGSGASAVTFQPGTNAYFSGSNLFAGDNVLQSLGVFGVADQPTIASLRTVEKIGFGTAVLNNVTYTLPVVGSDASASFAWNLGNTAQTTFGGA